MENFDFYNPVRVIFGAGGADDLGGYAAEYGKKAMLVSYAEHSFLDPLFARLHKSLESAGVGYVDYFAATANPKLCEARAGVEICKKNGVDVVIGVGGGSVMDTAKLIAAGVYYKHDLSKMIVFSHSDGGQIPPEKALPMILMPTLPATGSETNSTAVVTDEKTMRKSYVWAPQCMYAKIAIIDPALTVSLPAFQTACGAVDTVAHIAEGYFNGAADYLGVQDGMQEGVIKNVLARLPEVLANPDNIGLRGEMLWSASIALNGWVLSGTYQWAPMHQMGHVLSARFNATHGATLAIMILAWMRFFENRKDNGRYVKYADKIYGKSLHDAADEYEEYLVKVGLPTRISAFGVTEADIDTITDEVVSVSFNSDGVLGSNPALTRDEVAEIYRIALG